MNRYFIGMIIFLVGTSHAQTAVQLSILSKMTNGVSRKQCIPVPNAGDIRDAVCGESSGVPAMSATPKSQLEYPEWIQIASSTYFNIWKSSVSNYVVYLSEGSKQDFTQVTVSAPGAAPPTKSINRSGALASAIQARAAGATQGTGYTSAKDIGQFAKVTFYKQTATIKFDKHTIIIKVGQKTAMLNGFKKTIQGKLFILDGEVYYPVAIMKLLGCTVDPLINESGNQNATSVTCVVNGRNRNMVFNNWNY